MFSNPLLSLLIAGANSSAGLITITADGVVSRSIDTKCPYQGCTKPHLRSTNLFTAVSCNRYKELLAAVGEQMEILVFLDVIFATLF